MNTPSIVRSLGPNDVFVFGSNLKGSHGGGAAKLARKWGAKWGVGSGHAGQTYAIPTKATPWVTLGVEEIKPYVTQFVYYAKAHPELRFFVTKIGCGLAGYSVEDIAPLFEGAREIENIILPIEFCS